MIYKWTTFSSNIIFFQIFSTHIFYDLLKLFCMRIRQTIFHVFYINRKFDILSIFIWKVLQYIMFSGTPHKSLYLFYIHDFHSFLYELMRMIGSNHKLTKSWNQRLFFMPIKIKGLLSSSGNVSIILKLFLFLYSGLLWQRSLVHFFFNLGNFWVFYVNRHYAIINEGWVWKND